MATWILTYYEIGDKGEQIHHREEFPSIVSAKINLFFSRRHKRRIFCELKKKEK